MDVDHPPALFPPHKAGIVFVWIFRQSEFLRPGLPIIGKPKYLLLTAGPRVGNALRGIKNYGSRLRRVYPDLGI